MTSPLGPGRRSHRYRRDLIAHVAGGFVVAGGLFTIGVIAVVAARLFGL